MVPHESPGPTVAFRLAVSTAAENITSSSWTILKLERDIALLPGFALGMFQGVVWIAPF